MRKKEYNFVIYEIGMTKKEAKKNIEKSIKALKLSKKKASEFRKCCLEDIEKVDKIYNSIMKPVKEKVREFNKVVKSGNELFLGNKLFLSKKINIKKIDKLIKLVNELYEKWDYNTNNQSYRDLVI
jgi:transcriptional regulator